MQKEVINQYNNDMERELINLFHKSNLPLHFNKTGNKEFNNYQKMSLIILFRRSKKSLRDFIDENLKESKWASWLGLKKIPGKSTLHDWIKQFRMKTIRQLFKKLLPKNPGRTAIDGTGFDSWQRSRHYEKRIGNLSPVPNGKADLFININDKKILDFSIVFKHQHDVIAAEQIFKRFNVKNIEILADKGYDSEPLHELVRKKKGVLYAPVRRRNKRSLRKRPKGRYRRECMKLPSYIGERSIVESVNFSLKKKQIPYLNSKKEYMGKREFAWHMIVYNIRMNLKKDKEKQTNLIFLQIIIYPFPDRAEKLKIFLN